MDTFEERQAALAEKEREASLIPLPERVRLGEELMDRRRRGWRKRVKPERLNMADCESCVLGQDSTQHDYAAGAENLGLDPADCIRYGFTVGVTQDGSPRSWQEVGEEYVELTQLWLGVLAE